MSGFFKYFPTLFHSNTVATNIIARIRFEESVTKNLALFLPYQIQDGQRADQIAEQYYNDSTYDWIIYLSNNITDPLHQWPKTQDILENFITAKYGSIANAQQQIAYYRVNYETDDRVISTSAYDALGTAEKQYWAPILSYNNRVINYERKEISDVVETNKIVSLTGTFGTFTENDMIKQSSSVTGTVSFANSTNLMMKHVSGTWQANTPVYHMTTNVAANANITSVSTIATPISSDEQAYWSPVSQYDVEFETNEAKRHIVLLSSAYVNQIEKDMKDLMTS
jgi:hypothetical protein